MENENKKTDEKMEEKTAEKHNEEKKEKQVEHKDEKESKEKHAKVDNSDSKKTKEEKEFKEIKKQTKPKVKKEEAIVRGMSVPISTLHSIAICRFIKGKKIEDAIEYLEQTVRGKKAIPMKGEIPHRHGYIGNKRMMSGRFPKNASQEIIKLLKSLNSNANMHDIPNPIISEASASIASRPYGRFGSIKHKRTHVTIRAKSQKEKSYNKKVKEKKK